MQEMKERQVRFPGREDPLEEAMATHSSILAWRIPWTEEPGGRQSIGSQRVRHDSGGLACTQQGLSNEKAARYLLVFGNVAIM